MRAGDSPRRSFGLLQRRTGQRDYSSARLGAMANRRALRRLSRCLRGFDDHRSHRRRSGPFAARGRYQRRTATTQSFAGPWWREIVRVPDKDILLAAGLLFGLHVSLPAVAGFLVLYARQLGIEHFGWYYVASGATSLIALLLLGQLSDRVGRGAAIGAGFILEATAFCVVMNATTLGGMIMSGVLYMAGNAIGSSATLALALEHANPERRGQVIATYSIGLPAQRRRWLHASPAAPFKSPATLGCFSSSP